MKKLTLIPVLAIATLGSARPFAQKLGEDPYSLTSSGLAKRTVQQPLVNPSSIPPGFKSCGNGLLLRKEKVTRDNKEVEVKVLSVYFASDGSLTFFWPIKSRHWQRVLLVPAGGSGPSREIYPEIDLQETKKIPSISWELDQFFPGTMPTPGGQINGEPLLFHIKISPESLRCVKEDK